MGWVCGKALALVKRGGPAVTAKPAAANSGERYRPEIDGLRAVAVLAVIVHHFNRKAFPGGFLGVDIFFVISGYVITSAYWHRGKESLFEFLAFFYSRRVRRLVPALAVCVVVSSLVICLFDPDPHKSLLTGMYALVGSSNLYLWNAATDYFGQSAEYNPFTHTWSLGVEEQFYLLFPFALWLGRNRAGRLGVLLGVVAGVSLAAFCGLHWSGKTGTAYYMMPMRVWELAGGSLVFMVARRGSTMLARLRPSVMLVLLGVMVFWPMLATRNAFAEKVFVPLLFGPSLSGLLSTAGWVMGGTVLVVLATMALLAGLEGESGARRFLRSPAMVAIGRGSYSLYLWHWPVLVVARWTIGVSWLSAPLLLAMMAGLAYLSFRFVEQPFRYGVAGKTLNGRTVLIGMGALAVALVFVLGMDQMGGRLFTGQPIALSKRGGETIEEPLLREGKVLWPGRACALTGGDGAGKPISFAGCMIGSQQAGTPTGRRFLVLGNSYSAALVETLAALPEAGLGPVVVTSSFGASPVPTIPNIKEFRQANAFYWGQTVPSLLSQLVAGDSVLLVNDLNELLPAENDAAAQAKLIQLEAGLNAMVADLKTRGISVGFLHGLPLVREVDCPLLVFAQKQWFHTSPLQKACDFLTQAETLVRREGLSRTLLRVQQRFDTFYVIDLFYVFCPGQVCTFAGADGSVLYRDDYSHPSVEAARLARPIFLQHVQAFFAGQRSKAGQ